MCSPQHNTNYLFSHVTYLPLNVGQYGSPEAAGNKVPENTGEKVPFRLSGLSTAICEVPSIHEICIPSVEPLRHTTSHATKKKKKSRSTESSKALCRFSSCGV